MARFIPKQFAENSTTSVVFGSFQEQGGNVGDGTISSDPATLQGGTAWPLGWKAATDNFFQIPRGEEMEGLERVLSAAIVQQFTDGLTFWQSEMPVTQYQTIVQYQTGSDHPKLYVNITGDSTSTPPDSDTTNWFMFCDTAQVLANVSLTNSPYTTNRILEIPQDIKLELNNGTLTLKAGSKVYVPNGFEADGVTPKFDTVTVESDANCVVGGTFSNILTFYNKTFDVFYSCLKSSVYSGATAPTTPTPPANVFWYDTNTGNIKRYSDSWDNGGWSLTVCNITISSNSVTSIDQVFNGFGYIGSTVFALPEVKVQSPNGKNEDGTYKTIIRTIDSVRTFNTGAWGTRNLNIQISGYFASPYFEAQAVERFTYNKKFSSDTTTYSYDENTGVWWYSTDQSSWVEIPNNIVGFCRVESGKITQFQVGTVDSVANSNASNFSQAGRSYLSGLGMPSRYTNLTLLASGSTYTAPANGWFNAITSTSASGINVGMLAINTTTGFYAGEQDDHAGYRVASFQLPVRKGDVMQFYYYGYTAMSYFRFYYAEGEN